MKYPFLEAKERLIRIMGTFDLATGHADTFDELLDSLESELSDVLGYYRTALKVKEDELVATNKARAVLAKARGGKDEYRKRQKLYRF